MIYYKSKREIEIMRKAGLILAETRLELERHLKPGISTLELDKIAHDFITSKGAYPSFKDYEGFPGSICTSVNEVVVHGIPSKKVILKDGDIISIDIGVEYQGYHADSAWTYPIGNVAPEVLKLLEVTEQALYHGMEAVKPGNRVGDISYAVESFIKPHGYGIVKELAGHGIGRNLHEDPLILNFGNPNQGELLQEGMTICIEPMINLGRATIRLDRDGWTIRALDKKPSAHFEHMIAITRDGYEILTPKLKE
ncbi:MAG: type I methionyl aminopeptidase [Acholeplasmataceae bacterium]